MQSACVVRGRPFSISCRCGACSPGHCSSSQLHVGDLQQLLVFPVHEGHSSRVDGQSKPAQRQRWSCRRGETSGLRFRLQDFSYFYYGAMRMRWSFTALVFFSIKYIGVKHVFIKKKRLSSKTHLTAWSPRRTWRRTATNFGGRS